MNAYELEVYALLMSEEKVDEAEEYRTKCERAEWDTLGPFGVHESPNARSVAGVSTSLDSTEEIERRCRNAFGNRNPRAYLGLNKMFVEEEEG